MIPSPQPIQPDLGALIGQIPPPPQPPAPPIPDMGVPSATPIPPPPQPPALPNPAPIGFSQADQKRSRGGVPIQVAANAQKIYRQEEQREAQKSKNEKPMGQALKKPEGWGGGNG